MHLLRESDMELGDQKVPHLSVMFLPDYLATGAIHPDFGAFELR